MVAFGSDLTEPSGSGFGRNVQLVQRGALVGFARSAEPSARFAQERAGAGPVGELEGRANKAPDGRGLVDPLAYGPLTFLPYAPALIAARGFGISSEILGARLTSVTLGALAAIATFWLAVEAGLSRRLGLVAGTVTAFQPMWSQQTAIVTPDALTILLSVVTMALLLRFLRQRSPRAAVAGVACLAAGLLNKQAELFAVPVTLAIVLPSAWRFGLRHRALSLGTLAVAALASATLLATWLYYHPAIILPLHVATGGYLRFVQADGFYYGRHLFDSFWGDFGWDELTLPGGLNVLLRWISAALLCAPVIVLLRGKPVPRQQAVVLLAFAGAAVVQFFAFDLATFSSIGLPAAQGRYLLPVLPAMGVLCVAGLQAVAPRRAPAALAMLPATAMVCLNLAGLWTIWNGFAVA
jgi:4-amino-4-deoxy-L-arabinose transferase-like glycosyltransferase